MIAASEKMQKYFEELDKQSKIELEIASKARALGYDPDDKVEVQLAANMAERVVGLISVIAPQIIGAGIVERIIELEEKYGKLDWRVALIIAKEVAQEKYCKFDDKKDAIEVGVRIGFAYGTVGVVSSPLEGLINIDIKQRLDGKGEYFCLNYGGPVRNAGGTAAAWSVIIADYVRKQLGYAEYDPDEKEIKRCHTELEDYHERVTNLQYFPSKRESEFMVANVPVEISGDASEKREVSNFKDLPRVPTNKIRSGFCLIHSSCIPLKAPKLWKQLSKWGKDLEMDQWNFLEEFIKIQKEEKSKAGGSAKKDDKKEEKPKVKPVYTYIADLVAGRPVIGHPLRNGAFRLRYGRSRFSGFSAQSVHPASMQVMNDFIATGTQLKVERPGKGAAFTPCDTIEGPVVKLKDGSVHRLDTEEQAKLVKKEVAELIYLGDALINYGDFFDRAHSLIPPGYCEEWWVQEFEKAVVGMFGSLDVDKVASYLDMSEAFIQKILKDPLHVKPTAEQALILAKRMDMWLHPYWTFFWESITKEQLKELVGWFNSKSVERSEEGIEKIILPLAEGPKRALEILGVPHSVSTEHAILNKENSTVLMKILFSQKTPDELIKIIDSTEGTTLEIVNKISEIKQRDKCGVFIGGRMGRPEKAKMRKMTGSPHTLFPVGEEGGRLRCFQAALDAGKIKSEISVFHCAKCDKDTVLGVCPDCDTKTEKRYFCNMCGVIKEKECTHGESKTHMLREIDINNIFKNLLKKLKMTTYPEMIKGVRGTSNAEHVPEHLAKGILRAKHDIAVNKDGTVRYDCSELPVTHFKPNEIGTSVEKLIELGYDVDMNGKPLENDEQILEIKAQDLIIPCCPDALEEGSDKIVLRTMQFIDELLVKLYGLEPYYNAKTRDDIIGHLVIGLAPHTSAGTLGRIIGFSKTQAFFSHYLMHAAMRRDCFTYDSIIPVKTNGEWSLEKLGDIVERLNPTDIVDNFGTREIKVKGYATVGLKNGKITEVPINNFTKHTPQKIIKIKTKLGRKIRTTYNHKHIIQKDKKTIIKTASELEKGDVLKLPYNLNIKKKDIKQLNLIELLADKDWLMINGLVRQDKNLRSKLKKKGINTIQINNYITRDSIPLKYAKDLIKTPKHLWLSAKRDHIKIPAIIPVDETFLKLIGLYIAEGYSRKRQDKKGFYQTYIAAENKDVRNFIENTFLNIFNLKKSENKTDRVTYSSRILYTLFTEVLKMGSSAYEKRVPTQFLTLPNKKIGWILSGYLEGDGSVSKTDLRITFDTVSKGLLRDIDFLLGQFNIFVKNKQYTKQPGPRLKEFYIKKDKCIPSFAITKGTVQSKFVHQLAEHIDFISTRKKETFRYVLKNKKHRNLFCKFDTNYFYDEIISVKIQEEEDSYCLNVDNNTVMVNGILTRQCDGDESCFFLLLDTFLNFSRKYLPRSRGSTMDAPLVLTSVLNPGEVDDMAFNVDTVWKYPLEFYEAALEYKKPWDVKMEIFQDRLGKPEQYEGLGFTHDTSDLNAGVLCSSYKTLPSMEDKMRAQMDLAEKIRAVDEDDVARLVIEKHFIRDIKGNLRKFSQQQFRCVHCNTKFRRPPLLGKCTNCGGKIVFTISEGSIVKYLEPSLSLSRKYKLPTFLVQTLELTKRRIEGVFGKEKEIQSGLGEWFG